MMKKMTFTALALAAALSTVSLAGCAGNKSNAENSTAETAAEATEISLDGLLEKIKETYGEDYMPQTELDAQMLEDLTGIKPELYDSFVAEMPMISTFVESFIGIEAKDGKGGDVEAALNAYRDQLINDTMQYPMNVSTIQASQVVRHGDYVFFVMLGRADDDALDQGEEEALTSAQANNQTAVDVIDGFFKQ